MVRKIAYLTIDDAPSPDLRGKSDYLLSQKIPAVLFCEGQLINRYPSKVIYAIKKGFIIGNHAYDHPHFSDLSLKQSYEQIKKTDEIIENIYKKAQIPRPAKFFRFPFGDKGGLKREVVLEPYKGKGKVRKEKIQNFLKKLGYWQPKFKGITYQYYQKAGLLDDIDWHWTYEVAEWSVWQEEPFEGIDSLKKVLQRMDEYAPEKGKGLGYPHSEEIILLHDHVQTTQMFKPIIEKLLQKGLVFKLTPI